MVRLLLTDPRMRNHCKKGGVSRSVTKLAIQMGTLVSDRLARVRT